MVFLIRISLEKISFAELFDIYCNGCYPNGGNIVRRGKNLKIETLERNKLDSVEAIAYLVKNGKNNMSAYEERLTESLYFRQDPLLNKTVLVKPEWGTAAVYKALDNPKVYENFGKFTKDDLVDIWHE